MITQIENLVRLLKEHSRIVVFTGAGMSTESGISDYRSKGGIWERFRPVTLQEFLDSEEKRKLYWIRKKELLEQMRMAQPNAAHIAVMEIHELGKLLGLITQNIDGLHQAAGIPSDMVLEIHGTNRETVCLSCGGKTGWEETLERLNGGERIPLCKTCGGLLKPNTISFGQALDSRTLDQAANRAAECDFMLVVGSTLVVEPAASIPRIARHHGAKLGIINLTETPQDDEADLVIHAKAGDVLPEAVRVLKGKR